MATSAQLKQGYEAQPAACLNCDHRKKSRVGDSFPVKALVRGGAVFVCGLGGFPIRSAAVCDLWKRGNERLE